MSLVITTSLIAKEILMLLERELVSVNTDRMQIGPNLYNVEFRIEESDLLQPLDIFSKEFIIPCVAQLIHSSLHDISEPKGNPWYWKLLMSKSSSLDHHEWSTVTYKNMCVRVIRYYHSGENEMRIKVDFAALN